MVPAVGIEDWREAEVKQQPVVGATEEETMVAKAETGLTSAGETM